jgi:hypothetical protein
MYKHALKEKSSKNSTFYFGWLKARYIYKELGTIAVLIMYKHCLKDNHHQKDF